MLYAIMVMGGLGIIIGIALAAASKIFYVYVDPKVEAVEAVLPGANCGGCGLPGCSANAEAIVAGKASPGSCVAGDSELAGTIAAIMGVSVEAKEPDVALPGCTYGLDEADIKFIYNGINDCRAASLLSGGMKACNSGCLGLGSCAKACPFNAISMDEHSLPVVDEEKCTGCGTCERVCPKHIITLSSVTRRIIREYTIEECTTPCQRSCPAGIDIKSYIYHISHGNYSAAVQVIKERNPFPTVIGRICPRPCETDCRRQYIDEPVAINGLKRFAADYERRTGNRVLPYKAPGTGRKIAIIGGGVQGLSTAFFSARLGHVPTVFEATSELGGLLRTAIARNRLPMDILDWDISGLFEMGVKSEINKVMGQDFSVDSLLSTEFEAVFLASGGWDNKLARGAGLQIESLIPGTHLFIDLLRSSTSDMGVVINCGEDVVIAGKGRVKKDAVELLKKMGAENITILLQDEVDEPEAYREELENAGAVVVYHAGISRLVGEGEELVEIEYIDAVKKKTMVLKTTTLFLLSGRFPELIFQRPRVDGEPDTKTNRWEGIPAYKQPSCNDQIGLLAEGDALTDFSAAIKAIAAGRRGAASIHQAMYDMKVALPEMALTPCSPIQNVNHVEQVRSVPRQIMPLNVGQDESSSEELEMGFTEEMAKAEAERCLQCGLICYKHTGAIMSEMPTHQNDTRHPAVEIQVQDIRRVS